MIKLFSKVCAVEAAEASSPVATGETLSGVSFLPSFFLCASSCQRKKRINILMMIKVKPPVAAQDSLATFF